MKNGCGSDYKVKIEIWEESGNNDVLVEVVNLDYPTALKEVRIWSNRYIVIKEAHTEN